ncbi:MAG: type II toxin-antitoxin system PemK/MazF family toxin [Actinomycetota bacterium]|nr:type II toxin-antitoxin system PemK/MazF family toxin [Actinomycetota bacterium]
MATGDTDAPLFRLAVRPTSTNRLDQDSRIMVDKTTTTPRSRLGNRMGHLPPADVMRINRALALFLGLASR